MTGDRALALPAYKKEAQLSAVLMRNAADLQGACLIFADESVRGWATQRPHLGPVRPHDRGLGDRPDSPQPSVSALVGHQRQRRPRRLISVPTAAYGERRRGQHMARRETGFPTTTKTPRGTQSVSDSPVMIDLRRSEHQI